MCAATSRPWKREAGAWLERERVAAADRSFRYHADARYQGQNFEVIVPLPRPVREGMDEFVHAFHAAHLAAWLRPAGKDDRNRQLPAPGGGASPKAPLTELNGSGGVEQALAGGARFITVRHTAGWIRWSMRVRNWRPIEIRGPAVIEEMSLTILLALNRRRRGQNRQHCHQHGRGVTDTTRLIRRD